MEWTGVARTGPDAGPGVARARCAGLGVARTGPDPEPAVLSAGTVEGGSGGGRLKQPEREH